MLKELGISGLTKGMAMFMNTWIYPAFLLALGIYAAKRTYLRIHKAQVWLALLGLARWRVQEHGVLI